MSERVQIPAYTDRWMMGDRFGVVVKVAKGRSAYHKAHDLEIAHVKLDVSGKMVRVILSHCTGV